MQTVCAHCYTPLTFRRQRTMCILCTKCEQNWAAGNAPIRNCRLPTWDGTQVLPAQHDLRSF